MGTINSNIKAPLPERLREQIDKIVRSKPFRNAPSLQRLLHFVTIHATQQQSCKIKEYTIAAEVFDRGSDYDPKIDTTVRVEMRRLREKLREYYESEGVQDTILITIPKGQYLPTLEVRDETTAQRYGSPQQHDSTPQGMEQFQAQSGQGESGHYPSTPVGRVFLRRIVAVAVSFGLFLSGLVLGVRREKNASRSRSASVPAVVPPSALQADPVVEEFWRDILENESTPVVGYPDAVFLIDETNDLFRFRRGASDARGAPVDPHLALEYASNPLLVAKAGPLYYEDGYTGTGEIEGIALLAQLFSEMNLQMTVKRCREITIDDLKKHSMILLGSSFQNKVVAQLPSPGDFVFDNPEPRRELWRGQVINVHPGNGEKTTYRTERDPVTQVVKTDYALITVERGVVQGRSIVVLGGLDTTGSEGAVQFATSKSAIEQLLPRLKSLSAQARERRTPFFQALLRVNLQNGQDVLNTQLVSVHLTGPN